MVLLARAPAVAAVRVTARGGGRPAPARTPPRGWRSPAARRRPRPAGGRSPRPPVAQADRPRSTRSAQSLRLRRQRDPAGRADRRWPAPWRLLSRSIRGGKTALGAPL